MRRAVIKQHSIDILLVDDNRGDAELIYEAFNNTGTPKRIHLARDGEEALDYLYRRAAHKHASRPDLILLDINMPRKNGTEVLATIKRDETLQDIPVIMLTSSKAESDIRESYKLQANAYIVKPDTLDKLGQMTKMIEDFWAGTAALPKKEPRSCMS